LWESAAADRDDRGCKPLPQGRTSLTEWGGAARHNPLFTKSSILKILLILSNLSVCNPMFFRNYQGLKVQEIQ
jgi:hypothetical protein